jgi:peptidyl-tRNA hydrolase
MDTWETIEGDYRLLWPYKGKITAEVSDGEVYWKISTEPPNEIRAYVLKNGKDTLKKILLKTYLTPIILT